MALAPTTRLGPYEIIGAIGAGGMGEVYRARDTRLGRDVAIKILPEAFAADDERRQRFEREAKTLAALNHPNIAHVYDAGSLPLQGDAGAGVLVLVMELVEGEDLSARIARGPMPLADAVPIARQVAEAVEAAHDQGIVHRDLKPANIKVRDDGTVKVLDFGLAKAMQGDASSAGDASPSNSPTLTAGATQMGVIIGTAAYMAPEQAKGRPVDKRADIWAFGVVLYEMLTGRRAFEGEDVSTTLAAVLMRDPEFGALPPETPAGLVTLIRRCLDRDPKQRLRDIGEARVLLGSPDAMRGGVVAASPVLSSPGGGRAAWLVAGVAGLAALIFAGLWLSESDRPDAGARIEAAIAPPPGTSIGVGFALSPDGRRLVLQAVDHETGVPSLWLRDLASGTPTRLSGTEGGGMPFWSPDGSEVAFFAEAKLKRVDLQGSPPQVITDAPSPRGGAWGPDDRIVFSGAFRVGLEVVPASGGASTVLTELDAGRREKSHRWPVFLPDGEHIMFVAQTGEAGAKDDASTIEALSLATGERTPLVTANSSPLYAPPGFLLFWREGALRAQAFDAGRLAVSGSVFTVANDVAFDENELAMASMSADGTLVFQTGVGASQSDVLVVDRAGQTVRTVAESVISEGGLALSPEGSRLAVSITAPGARDQDVWIYDLARGTSAPLTFEEGGESFPTWSPDGASLFYSNNRVDDGVVFRRRADGGSEPEQVAVNPTGAGFFVRTVSSDERWLLNTTITDATSFDLVRYDLDTGDTTPLVSTPFAELTGTVSPDDRWLAYTSDQTGRPEVYVRSLGDQAGLWQVSLEGGSFPSWRADGRELYFLTPQSRLMAVGIDARETFRPSAPRELFAALFDVDLALGTMSYAPFPDGQRFVVDVLKERRTALLTLVTNWLAPSAAAR